MARFPKQPTLLIRTDNDVRLLEGIISECDALGWRAANLTYLGDYLAFEETPIGAIIEEEKPWRTIDRLRKKGVPIVRIWTPTQDDFEHDACLAEDRRAGGRLAADAFAERGFKEFGYVTITLGIPKDELLVGFMERAETVHGASVHLFSFRKRSKKETGSYKRFVDEAGVWLTECPKPLAILAANLRMGTRLLAACERVGLSVPEQVAIACRGEDDGLCRTSLVPMSAIDMNRAEMGRQAVQVVQRLVHGEAPPRETIYVPVKGFVARRSTDILAVADPMVAKAMRFIWDHIDRPLSVDDVALEVTTSRATLERAFRRTLNRGISEELRRKRLAVCKDLLRTTRMSLAEIADAIGLTSRRHLHRAFKDAFGTTPQQYRLSHKPKISKSS